MEILPYQSFSAFAGNTKNFIDFDIFNKKRFGDKDVLTELGAKMKRRLTTHYYIIVQFRKGSSCFPCKEKLLHTKKFVRAEWLEPFARIHGD